MGWRSRAKSCLKSTFRAENRSPRRISSARGRGGSAGRRTGGVTILDIRKRCRKTPLRALKSVDQEGSMFVRLLSLGVVVGMAAPVLAADTPTKPVTFSKDV